MNTRTPNTVILTAPQGWGKTVIAESLRAEYGCSQVIDSWSPCDGVTVGGLHLTNMSPNLLMREGISHPIVAIGWNDIRVPTPAVSFNQKAFPTLLQWSAEDLADPAIRSDAQRLAVERTVAAKRLAPYIEPLVALAWAQVQSSPNSAEKASP